MSDWFTEALARYGRVAITGAPKSGKTTICQRVDQTVRPLIHGDDYLHLGWSESSQKMADIVNAIRGPMVVEGVQVPRALRKGMLVDVVVWLDRHDKWAHQGHETMGKGAWTVLGEWRALHPQVPVLIQTGLTLRNALPVMMQEPNDFDDSARRRVR